MRSVRIVPGPAELAAAAAEEFCRLAGKTVSEAGRFSVALSGGSTPERLYRLLAGEGDPSFRSRVPWEKVHIFFSDERHVPPDDPASNHRMAHETLLSRVPIPLSNVERVRSEWAPEEAARDYEDRITMAFHLPPGAFPRFDLILLGMGTDGHTASLFPGSTALNETKKIVAAPWVDKLISHRFTLTPVTINRAASVIFLVSGEEKAETLRNVLEGVREPDRLPSQIVNPVDGDLLWLVDRGAARLLSHPA